MLLNFNPINAPSHPHQQPWSVKALNSSQEYAYVTVYADDKDQAIQLAQAYYPSADQYSV